MPRRFRCRIVSIVAAGVLSLLTSVDANDSSPPKKAPLKRMMTAINTTDRIIVRLHDTHDEEGVLPAAIRARPMSADRSRSLSIAARTTLTPIRRTGSGAQVVGLTHDMELSAVEAIVERLKKDPAVAHAEPDRRKMPLTVPTDPGYRPASGALGQWNLRGGLGGINLEPAWSISEGSPNTVIAVLDTGLLPDLEFLNRTFPGAGGAQFYGYDFISEDGPGLFKTANDGDPRDPDPRDPGNWITAAEAGAPPFTDCATAQDSDWHGTHTTGIIAANAKNGSGIAGIDWNAKIVPVRVLGKCGGYTSDIIDGMRWAAGLPVAGVPANSHPANIINMSLGGFGACSTEEQLAINQALAQPNVKAIVSAAGNDGGTSLNTAPGNCTNVITVTATDFYGTRAPYSNGGANVALSAPGGYFGIPPAGSSSDELGILSIRNSGRTIPSQSPSELVYFVGTSEAAAHVSGVVGLMVARNPALTPYQVYAIVRGNARAFPDSTCTIATCGSGILDATASVQASATPPADRGLGFGGINQVPASGAAPTSAGSSSGGGGGGGGCTIGDGARPEWLLALFVLVALVRNQICRRPARPTGR